MNFVIFSYNFLPLNDAEAYCTTRFASALSFMGHSVTVVTMDHKSGVSDQVYHQLIDDKLRIVRLPIIRKEKPLLARIRYFTYEWEAVCFSSCIKKVKEILSETEEPILITRTNPLASSIVGWHCRRYAKKWIAHLSDPIPIPGRDTGWKNTHKYVNNYWMKHTLRDADIVSVTCPNAVRAFQDMYGSITKNTRFIVTPHIGDPPLRSVLEKSQTSEEEVKQIVHKGLMCFGRGAENLIDAVAKLNNNGLRCEYIQCGQVDDVNYLFTNNPFARRLDRCDGDVEYIPDLKVPLPYCPFLSSKFVYRIYDNKPILLYTNKDSLSAELAMKYPEAGIFFADNSKAGALKETLKKALSFDPATIDRSRIRQEFTRERIGNDFLSAIK